MNTPTPVRPVWLVLLLILAFALPADAQPSNFRQGKVELREHVYHDRTDDGTLYCGCRWRWVGESGGRTDLQSCGYQVRSETQRYRAERTEWEHIVPASDMGRARQCWQNGGRSNCNRVDPVFNAMEADMHNLTPSVGEVNANRSNYRFGMVPGGQYQYGACKFKVDPASRVVEPRDEVKGMVARVHFYIFDRYDLRMSRSQQQLFMAWDRQFPPSEWEVERDRRIAARMGNHNPFVTGERRWELGHRNRAEGVVSALPAGHPALPAESSSGAIRGNRNSRVYHLPSGCPSYNRVAEHNRVEFESEAAAQSAGFRKAGNCR